MTRPILTRPFLVSQIQCQRRLPSCRVPAAVRTMADWIGPNCSGSGVF
jgi:hypothetical protein